MLKNIINHFKLSHQQKKSNLLKGKLRTANHFYQIEADIFNLLRASLTEDKLSILNALLETMNDIDRMNNMYLDEKQLKKESAKFPHRLIKNNYEVFIMDRRSPQDKLKFSTLPKMMDIEWFKMNIRYQNNINVEVTGLIIDQDALFLDFSSDMPYHFEDGYLDLPYDLELLYINQF